MEAAFDRLTSVQKDNINKYMFEVAYKCVVKSEGNTDYLKQIVRNETRSSPHLEKDLFRYCKLVSTVE
jgi:hypothetical protein